MYVCMIVCVLDVCTGFDMPFWDIACDDDLGTVCLSVEIYEREREATMLHCRYPTSLSFYFA